VEYDYIIVGAGSAGCVLANRLSADPATQVLLVEAGGSDKHMNVKVPAAFSKVFKTELDWDLATEPEANLGDRSLYIPRGKMLGGSSSMNAMIYIRGRRQDYDAWEAGGAAGWSYDEVLPYFRRSEHNERIQNAFHGQGGELNVTDLRSPNPLTQAFVASCLDWGMPSNPDFNGADQLGAGTYQVTQKGGARWSAASAFLRPVGARPNLTISTGVTVNRLLLDGSRAIGVEFSVGTVRDVARCRGEVILSAGTFNSPQILMLSGVGPAAELRSHGIDVAIDLPVGVGLQDHPAVATVWESTKPVSLADAERPRHVAEYLAFKRGKLSSNIGEGGAFVRTRDELTTADVQYHFGPAYFVEHGFRTSDRHAFTIGPTLISVESRGAVRLRSGDPAEKVRIEGNFLGHGDDVRSLVAGVKLARELAAQPSFTEFRGEELLPGPNVESDRDIEAYCRHIAELLYHPTSTCPIGAPGSAVVDPELRVYGLENVRVADASVMPSVTGGNTNAPTIMIAEKAAAMILERVPGLGHDAPAGA
jgi:choline dehydrogenase